MKGPAELEIRTRQRPGLPGAWNLEGFGRGHRFVYDLVPGSGLRGIVASYLLLRYLLLRYFMADALVREGGGYNKKRLTDTIPGETRLTATRVPMLYVNHVYPLSRDAGRSR